MEILWNLEHGIDILTRDTAGCLEGHHVATNFAAVDSFDPAIVLVVDHELQAVGTVGDIAAIVWLEVDVGTCRVSKAVVGGEGVEAYLVLGMDHGQQGK